MAASADGSPESCDICGKPLGRLREWQFWKYRNYSTLDLGSIAKHTGCGPPLKCGHCMEELNEEFMRGPVSKRGHCVEELDEDNNNNNDNGTSNGTELPVDIWSGRNYSGIDLLMNYCSSPCAKEDANNLWTMYNEDHVDNVDDTAYRPDVKEVATINGSIWVLLGYFLKRNADPL